MSEDFVARLFFVDDLCPSCPMYVFVNHKWQRAKLGETPVAGDHIVLDMRTEKIVNKNGGYRKMAPREKRLWNGSYPDGMPVSNARVDHHDLDELEDMLLLDTPTERLRATRI